MKTGDLVQMAALGVVLYLAYQKFAVAKTPTPSGAPGSTNTPTTPLNTGIGPGGAGGNPLTPDFGLTDPTWGTDSTLVASPSAGQWIDAALQEGVF